MCSNGLYNFKQRDYLKKVMSLFKIIQLVKVWTLRKVWTLTSIKTTSPMIYILSIDAHGYIYRLPIVEPLQFDTDYNA